MIDKKHIASLKIVGSIVIIILMIAVLYYTTIFCLRLTSPMVYIQSSITANYEIAEHNLTNYELTSSGNYVTVVYNQWENPGYRESNLSTNQQTRDNTHQQITYAMLLLIFAAFCLNALLIIFGWEYQVFMYLIKKVIIPSVHIIRST